MLLNVIYINKEHCLVLLVSHQSVCLVLHWWQQFWFTLRILQLPICPHPSQPLSLFLPPPPPPPPPMFFFLLISQCEKCLVLMLELIAWRCKFTSHGDKTLSRDWLTDCAIKWKPLELLNYNMRQPIVLKLRHFFSLQGYMETCTSNIYGRGKLASRLSGVLRRQCSLCSRRLEVVGARKNGHVRERHAM